MRDISNWQDYRARGWSSRPRQLYDMIQQFMHWAPALSGGLAFGASFVQSVPLRLTTAGLAVFLFLFVAADVTRSLWEPDRGPSNPLSRSRNASISPMQVVVAGFLALLYTFLLLGALRPLILTLRMPGLWTMAFTIPSIFLVSCLIAWRNSRLWYCEATEYEELLTENQNELAEIEKLEKMRLPSSFWEHPKL
ncbi:MAG TPA: hypothetical protein VGK36_04680 [Candidatus Angelobacter sp.]|jgi:hypothetical protein